MTNLDTKLRTAIERMWGAGIDYAMSPDFKELSEDEKDKLYERYKTNVGTDVLAQIKQAFADEQLQDYMTQYGTMTELKVKPPRLMTGQEWYDRFEKAIHVINPPETPSDVWMRQEILDTAKRASGIDEETK